MNHQEIFEITSPTKKIKLSQIPKKDTTSLSFFDKRTKVLTFSSHKKEPISKISAFMNDQDDQPNKQKQIKTYENLDNFDNYLPSQLHFTRKITKDFDHSNDIFNLPFFKNNSTFEQKTNDEGTNRGDNKYINKEGNKKKQTRNVFKTKEQTSRLQIDYEVQHFHKRGDHLGYKCMSKIQRLYYFIKQIQVKQSKNDEVFSFMRKYTLDQIKVYNQDIQNNFIRYFNFWSENQSIFLSFQFATCSLGDMTNDGIRLKEKQVWDIITNSASALLQLQKTGSSHSNIRPGNILKCTKRYKLADPFVSKENFAYFLNNKSYLARNRGYIAPQIRNYNNYLNGIDLIESDIYSLGICLIENLMNSNVLQERYARIKYQMQKHLFGYSPTLQKTLLNMIKLDPCARPQAKELKNLSIQNFESKNILRKRHSI